jgi:hypothetical protein
MSLTGSWIVDVRQIKDASVSRRYVQKYVVKQLAAQIFARVGRVVCFTRRYCPPPERPDGQNLSWSRHPDHPLELADLYAADFTAEWSGRICSLTRKHPVDVHVPIPCLAPLPT